jgi:hypothetical protein
LPAKKVMFNLGYKNRYSFQGCQIFLGAIYQNGKNIPNDNKIYQMAVKRPNGHKIYTPSIARPYVN